MSTEGRPIYRRLKMSQSVRQVVREAGLCCGITDENGGDQELQTEIVVAALVCRRFVGFQLRTSKSLASK